MDAVIGGLMTPKALAMIEATLKPILEAGRDINRLVMYVSDSSRLAKEGLAETKYGCIPIVANTKLPQGAAYIMEDAGRIGRAFGWIIKAK